MTKVVYLLCTQQVSYKAYNKAFNTSMLRKENNKGFREFGVNMIIIFTELCKTEFLLAAALLCVFYTFVSLLTSGKLYDA